METGRRRRRRLEFDQRVRRRGAGRRTLRMVGRRWVEREPRVTGVVSGRRPREEVLEARRGSSVSWREERTEVLRNKLGIKVSNLNLVL